MVVFFSIKDFGICVGKFFLFSNSCSCLKIVPEFRVGSSFGSAAKELLQLKNDKKIMENYKNEVHQELKQILRQIDLQSREMELEERQFKECQQTTQRMQFQFLQLLIHYCYYYYLYY